VIDQYISGRSCDDANHLGIVDNARQNPKKNSISQNFKWFNTNSIFAENLRN